MRNIMKKAWAIYRTLTNGTHREKLSAALKKAWAEVKKKTFKSMKEQCIDRLNTIIAHSAQYDYCDMYVVAKDWANYGQSRTYIKIVERAVRGSKHYVERDYGYIDNITGAYVAGKHNCFDNYTFSGAKF